ncbi:MAG: hypothetical protein IPJ66_14980 [Bacteroidetes bacterium]|nr:hypothetical protein [Bacteroidota bacterium]
MGGFPGEHYINGLAADDSGNVFIVDFFTDSLNLGEKVSSDKNTTVTSLA